jgi:DNA-binding NarL/FixJ family response regulator
MATKILIVSSNPIYCRGISVTLGQEKGWEVVAEAHSGEQALQKLREATINVVLMDASLSDMNGAEATLQIKKTYQQVKVLALSVLDNFECVLNILRAGASGCLIKDFTIEELFEAIRKVISNKSYLCSATTEVLVKKYQHLSDQQYNSNLFPNLTAREKDVLKLIAMGKTNAKIGEILEISTKTVESHRGNIISKLKLKSVAEMTRYAIKEGLIS